VSSSRPEIFKRLNPHIRNVQRPRFRHGFCVFARPCSFASLVVPRQMFPVYRIYGRNTYFESFVTRRKIGFSCFHHAREYWRYLLTWRFFEFSRYKSSFTRIPSRGCEGPLIDRDARIIRPESPRKYADGGRFSRGSSSCSA